MRAERLTLFCAIQWSLIFLYLFNSRNLLNWKERKLRDFVCVDKFYVVNSLIREVQTIETSAEYSTALLLER